MSFKMIREAQALARLGDKAQRAQQIQRIIGVDSVLPIVEAFDQKEFEVTPQHYNQWLATIHEIAAERNVSLRTRQNFNDLAFEILDNDSLVDALGGDPEQTKNNIIKALWQAQQVSKAHTRVQDHVQGVIDKTREEEEVVNQLVGSEDEESGFGQAFATSKGVEQEERTSPRVGRQPIYQRALRPGKVNPYPVGSLRAALWADSHKSVEDEEFDDQDFDGDYGDDVDVAGEPEVDTAAMSPDDLASHITGSEGGEPGMDGEDLEARVDDLEDRIADLEHADPEPDTSDEMADQEIEASPQLSEPKAEPRANVIEKGFDDEEQVKSMFRKAITSPKEHMSAALKDIEAEGTAAWSGIQMPKNPHAAKSPAHAAWAKAFKASAKAALGLNDKPREPTSKQRSKKR